MAVAVGALLRDAAAGADREALAATPTVQLDGAARVRLVDGPPAEGIAHGVGFCLPSSSGGSEHSGALLRERGRRAYAVGMLETPEIGRRVRRATTLEEVGRLLLEPGTVVEMDPAEAEACGAILDDCISAAEAFEAAGDPFEFGDEAPA